MNDCVWSNIYNCKGMCGKCREGNLGYLSMNSEEGSKIMETYCNLIEAAIEPIREMLVKEHLDVSKIPMRTNVEV